MNRTRLRQGLALVVDALADALEAPGPGPAAPAGPVGLVPIDEIKVDPATYQFRLSAIGKGGVDQRLSDCATFRRELAGVVLVWREPGGQLALLDGHHRRELARRSGVAELACLEVEADSPRAARVIGALSNVAAGNATPADLARLMRDEGMKPAQLAEYGVSKRSALVADAAALLPLDERLFARHCTGELPLAMALALAAAGPPAHQRALAREAQRRGWGADQVAEAARLASVATVSTTTPDGCLPGLEALMESANSDLGAILAIRAAIRRQLSSELLALRCVARRRSAEVLEGRGVAVVDREAASEARDSSRAQQRVFDTIAGHAGPLQECIRELAQLVNDRHPAGEVVAQNIHKVREAIEAELGA